MAEGSSTAKAAPVKATAAAGANQDRKASEQDVEALRRENELLSLKIENRRLRKIVEGLERADDDAARAAGRADNPAIKEL